MNGTLRLTTLLLLLVRPALAQLSTAEVHQSIDMGVNAAQALPFPGSGASDSYNPLPTTIPVSGSGSDTLPLKVLHVSKGGTATASAFVSWSIGPTSINATAEFGANTTATGDDSAAAHFDHGFGISFRVSSRMSYRITGNVRTATELESSDRLTCQFNQTPLAGADPTALPPSAAVLFEREGLVHPEDDPGIECFIIGGAALTDSANQRWDFTIQLTPEPTSTTTIPKRECKQACKQGKAECKAACPTTGKEKRACRKDCKKRAKQCGQSTGCVLPAAF